jgi:hypothetical protein
MRAFAQGEIQTRLTKSPGPEEQQGALAAQSPEISSILRMQRTVGNQAVQRLVQQAGPSEPEAPSSTRIATHTGQIAVPPLVHRDAHAALDAAAGTEGTPLPSRLRARLERTAGADLSAVRVHTGALSARAADAVDAAAYTTGQHIHFGAGQFNPGSHEGQHLIAHEVAHTLQQGERSWRAHAGLSGGSRDAREVDADRFADAFSAGVPRAVHPVAGGGDGVIARRPKHGAEPAGSPPGAAEAAPHGPSWETSLAVINAIADIINVSVEVRQGLVYETQYPAQHPEVPPEYLPLLEEWYFIKHGASVHNQPGKPIITIRGAMLSTHIDGAVADTMPFINELLKEGEPESTGSFLEDRIFKKIDEFRHRALEEEVSDTIAAGAKAIPKTARTDLEHATEEEKLSALLPEAVETVARANIVINRFLSEHVEKTVERAEKVAKLEELFEEIREEALKAGEAESSAVLRPVMRMDLPASLVFLHGALDGVVAILAVADPEERKKLFTRQMGWAAEAARVVDVVKLLEQFVGGAVAITAAATYAFARVTGNTKLAAEVLGKGIPNVENVILVLNIVGVIHGVLVLLDENASGEEKASAVLDIGVGGIGIGGRLAPHALGEIAGPLSASLVISFYTIKWLGEAAAGAAVGFTKAGLNGVFEDMKQTALYVQSTALKLATAAELASIETDAIRTKELLSQAAGLRWNLVEALIKPYLKRATIPGLRRNVFGILASNDPANWSNDLIGRFQPLVGRPGGTFEEALNLAADFLKVVAKCFAEQEEILQRTVDEAVGK